MAELLGTWLLRFTFVVILLVVITMGLLPLNLVPGSFPAPDFMFCMIGAWIIRRPALIPVYLVAASALLAEILFYYPLGLWTALVILASELLRSNMRRARYLPFTFEWALFSLSYAVAVILYNFILTLAFVTIPEVRLVLLKILFTILAYPVVVVLSNTVFQVRKGRPTDDGIIIEQA